MSGRVPVRGCFICECNCVFWQFRQRGRFNENGFQLAVKTSVNVSVLSRCLRLHCSVSTVRTNVKNTMNSPLFLLSHIISPAIWLKIELYANVLLQNCQETVIQKLCSISPPNLFLVAAQWKSRAMLRWDDCVAPVHICILFACTQLGSQGRWMIHRYFERGQKLLY